MATENCIDTIPESVTMSPTWRGWVEDGKRLISAEILCAAALVKTWGQRSRSRRHLGTLDARLLQDVGLSAQVAQREAQKPFWKD